VTNRAFALAALLSAAACAPVVMHGPRVVPGTEYQWAAGWRSTPCDSCGAGLVPPIGFTARQGWAPDGPEGAAFSAGVLVPGFIFIPAASLDLYAQAPAPADRPVFGGGVTLSALDVMPYVQAGRTGTDGTGWYTTQGVVLAAFRSEPEVFLNGGRGTVFDRVASVYWSPTVAYQGAGFHAYLSGALGSHDPSIEGEPARRIPLRSLLFGVALRMSTPRLPWEAASRATPRPRAGGAPAPPSKRSSR